MKYVEFINGLIRKETSARRNVVLFGQNINAGSCLGGLTKNLQVGTGGRIINTPNSENALVGFGFGLMLNGVSSVFFMKQLDFLPLAMDQVVNTYRFIRNLYAKNPPASFTIVPIVVDSGYEGPQSCLNNFADICSLGRARGLTITNASDAQAIISGHLVRPGFRIIAVSQRLMKTEIITPEKLIWSSPDQSLFQYSRGKDATIVCFNFSFPQGWEMRRKLLEDKIQASLFTVNSPTPVNWSRLRENTRATKRLVVIDDSKSENIAAHSVLADLASGPLLQKRIIVKRKIASDWLNPVSDKMEIDYDVIANVLRRKSATYAQFEF